MILTGLAAANYYKNSEALDKLARRLALIGVTITHSEQSQSTTRFVCCLRICNRRGDQLPPESDQYTSRSDVSHHRATAASYTSGYASQEEESDQEIRTAGSSSYLTQQPSAQKRKATDAPRRQDTKRTMHHACDEKSIPCSLEFTKIL